MGRFGHGCGSSLRPRYTDIEENVVSRHIGTGGTQASIDLGEPNVIPYPFATVAGSGPCEAASGGDPSLGTVCLDEEGMALNANHAVERPARNLCIAQKIREAVPGTAAAFGLWMPAAELRKLVEMGRRLTQQAVVQYARLGLIIVPRSTWEPDFEGYFLWNEQYPYGLKLWANEPQFNDALRDMSDDFATAVQLLTYFTSDEARLFHRDSWAHTSSGNKQEPATRADATWGNASWMQRYESILHGGRPLSIWAEAFGKTEPAAWRLGYYLNAKPGYLVDNHGQADWPTAWLPYTKTRIDEPEVYRLENLMRRLDLMDFAVQSATATEGSFATHPAKRCYSLQKSQGPALYQAVEAKLRGLLSLPPLDPLPDPTASENLPLYEIWERHRITPAHADVLVAYMADQLGDICVGPGSTPLASVVEGEIVAKTEGGDIALIHLSPATTLHPLHSTQRVPQYESLFHFTMPKSIDEKVDAADQGFPLVGSLPHPYEETKDISRAEALLGSNTALTAARIALADALEADSHHPYLERADDILHIIGAEIGEESISFRPQFVAVEGPTPVWRAQIKHSGDPPGSVWDLDVTFKDGDAFWDQQAHYDVHAVANDPHIGPLARYPLSNYSLGFGTSGSVSDLSSHPGMEFGDAKVVPGTALRRRSATIFLPPAAQGADHSWTLVARRWVSGGTFAESGFRVLVDGFKYRPVVWDTTLHHGYFHSFGGASGAAERAALEADQKNRSLQQWDPFGFARNRAPMPNPDEYLGSGAPDAASHWIHRGKQAAEEATAAVSQAVQALGDQQADEALLSAEKAKSSALLQLEQAALCGAAGDECDTEVTLAAIHDPTIDYANPYPGVCNGTDPPPVPPAILQTFELLGISIDALKPSIPRIDCVTRKVVELTRAEVPLAEEVRKELNAAKQPSFQKYAGGALQGAFIRQWSAAQKVRAQVKLLDALRQAANQRKAQAEALAEQASAAYWAAHYHKVAQCEAGVFDSIMGSLSAGAVGGQSLPTMANNCKVADYELKAAANAQEAAAASAKAVYFEAVAQIRNQMLTVIDSMSELAQSGAAIQELTAKTDLAIARAQLEASLAANSATTSFGLYRRYHHHDLWRAYALMEDARRYGSLALRATEARFVVDTAMMLQPEPLVAAPASWASSIYAYDLNAVSTVGLLVSEPSSDGIHPNALKDYFANLQRFADGFSISRPSAVAKSDSDVLTLPGPGATAEAGYLEPDGQTVTTVEVADAESREWRYLCGTDAYSDVTRARVPT